MGSLFGDSTTVEVAGVTGEFNGEGGSGVLGVSATGHGVHGDSTTNHGVHGHSTSGRGVQGISETFFGVGGTSTDGVGVFGESATNVGVLGKSPNSFGVQGISETNHGVHGDSTSGRGVVGTSQTFFGVSGESKSGDGVFGISDTGIGVHGKGGRLAGFFEGKVEITESLKVQGIDVVGLLRRLQQLEPIFAELEAARRARSNISVQQLGDARDGGAFFQITGNNFRAGATIKIEVTSNGLRFLNTDGEGTLGGPNSIVALSCRRSTVLTIHAFDETTSQTSNVVTITCT